MILFEISTLAFLKMQSFGQIKNTSDFETNMGSLGIFGQLFWITIAMFEINIHGFVKMQGFMQKLKSLNLPPTTLYANIFELQF